MSLLKTIFSFLIFFVGSSSTWAYDSISLDELKKAHDQKSKDTLFLDVRSPGEFAEGHIPGSQNIDFRKVPSQLETIKKYKEIYVYCKSGGRASHSCRFLQSKGLNVKCADRFGFDSWKSQKYKVQKP